MSSGQIHGECRAARFLVKAEPLGRAEELCRRMVAGVRSTEGLLELEADPAWAWAINTVLVKKGVRVSELSRAA